MKRRFRLRRSIDIKRVRRSGKSYAHPLVVLYALGTDQQRARIGVTAGTGIGNAVHRNRAKRLLRVAANNFLPRLLPGADLLLIARAGLSESSLQQTQEALSDLFTRARLLTSHHED